jgi:DMSO/TMAO reductase YedYZ molybdopterin-dependent catalytic subunit
MNCAKRVWFGALSGLALTIPLTTLFYAGYRLAGFPFIPFNLFDWTTRHLPGAALAAGINSMVRVITWLHIGRTSVAAKLAEQAMAVVGFVAAGVIVGAIFFGVARFFHRRFTVACGLAVGGVLGAIALLISRIVEITPQTHPGASALWIMGLFLTWGAALGWACRHTVQPAPADAREPGAAEIDRRGFMIRFGSAAAVVALVGAALGKLKTTGNRGEASRLTEEPWSAQNPLPNANAAVKAVPGTRAEFTPLGQHYRIDINTTPPEIAAASWQLKMTGLVQRPLAWTLDDLRGRTPMHQFITLACISNTIGGDLIGTTRWTGVSLQQLLPELGLLPNATHLKIRSADGFYEVVALDTIRSDERVMLTYAWDGLPLAQEHGFPLRIYIPDRYGMKQPKWIASMEAIDHWEPGFWVTRGWDREARMKATSAIDAIATNMMIGQPNARMQVPIGGFAHAGVRRISRVEVRVDDGPWQQAALRTPLSGQTWVIWRYDWPMQKGKHQFTVRCFEGDGTPQLTQEAPPDPSGASGLYSRSAMF